jgi:hypothetical protein
MSRLHQLVLLGLVVSAVAVVSGGASAARALPVAIDTVSIEGGVVTVTGVVDAGARLEVNGRAVDVSGPGGFVAQIDLDADALVLSLPEEAGEAVTISIPIGVLVATEGDGALNDLAAAGVSIDVPVGGFTVVDGQGPLVEGNVLHAGELAGLTVNGIDVLDRVLPTGGFGLQLPSKRNPPSSVTVVATDRSGVSQTTRYRVSRITSVIKTKSGTSVSAAGARGLVISRLRLDKRTLAATGRLGVLVTVKDRRGYLVRGAALRLVAMPRMHIANGSIRAGFTNRVGKARFTYRVRMSSLASMRPGYLTVATRAKTPTVTVMRRVSLRLPKGGGL